MRYYLDKRITNETVVNLSLRLDESEGETVMNTGSRFFDHMLTQIGKHSGFDFKVDCSGDINVDFHHSAEDIGILFGIGLKEALGDKRGIKRYADIILPMDEALVMVALDISGRAHLSMDIDLPAQRCGSFDTELVREFFEAFVRNAGITLHIRQLAGVNTHHIIEAIFKAVGRVLGEACSINEKRPDDIPSSKGVL